MSTDKNRAAKTPGNDNSPIHGFTKWVSPEHWVGLLDSFESSPRTQDVALVVLGAEVGFVTSTLGFLSAILGGLTAFVTLAVLVALNACIAGYLIYKVMHIEDNLRGGNSEPTTGALTEK